LRFFPEYPRKWKRAKQQKSHDDADNGDLSRHNFINVLCQIDVFSDRHPQQCPQHRSAKKSIWCGLLEHFLTCSHSARKLKQHCWNKWINSVRRPAPTLILKFDAKRRPPPHQTQKRAKQQKSHDDADNGDLSRRNFINVLCQINVFADRRSQ
jgi:hypothetical protein